MGVERLLNWLVIAGAFKGWCAMRTLQYGERKKPSLEKDLGLSEHRNTAIGIGYEK